MIMSLKQKTIKIKPTIKLNHNIYNLKCCYSYNLGQNNLRSFFFFAFAFATSHNRTVSKSATLRKEDPFPPSSTFLPTDTQGMRRSFRHNTTASPGVGVLWGDVWENVLQVCKIVQDCSDFEYKPLSHSP